MKLPGSVLMVEPGQDRKALVSFAESPGKFYVNMLEANIEHMEELEEALCKHYSIVSNLVSLVTIEEARYLYFIFMFHNINREFLHVRNYSDKHYAPFWVSAHAYRRKD